MRLYSSIQFDSFLAVHSILHSIHSLSAGSDSLRVLACFRARSLRCFAGCFTFIPPACSFPYCFCCGLHVATHFELSQEPDLILTTVSARTESVFATNSLSSTKCVWFSISPFRILLCSFLSNLTFHVQTVAPIQIHNLHHSACH